MAEERVVQPEAPRMTMYQLLHHTQSSIPSCIMFPPNAPHVEIKQWPMAILPDFRGLENEKPYVHVRAFEVVIGSFYAQNVIEMTKLRFFPFSLRDKAKVACGGGFLQKESKDAMDYLDEIAENSNTWNGPSPLDSTDWNRSSTTTSSGSVFKIREEDNMSVKISLLTKEIEALKLKGSRGEQNQRFKTMFTRIDEEKRETKSQVARLTKALSKTERGKLPSQTQPNPNNQNLKVVNTDKFKEVKSITILRSGKEIGKSAPKVNEKTKETPAEKDEIKVNLPLLHLIKQMPLYAKIIKDLCTVKRKDHVKKTAFLTEQVSAIIQHKVPPKYKDPGCPTISCTIGDYNIERALLDLGANVNLLPFSVYLQLGLGELKPISVTLQLADRFVRKPRGVVEDVLVKVENFYYPVDFIILDIESTLHPSTNIPIILVPSKMSMGEEGEKIKTFESHKTKRKTLQDTRLSRTLLNRSKGVALHVARMKSARGRNYSFGGSRLGG
uniref:Retrotransposon gag domain-containing protein n=1 Tax=Fagus sylvatica TaxID=28930 RepID=A0A2N9IV22_FAGSY